MQIGFLLCKVELNKWFLKVLIAIWLILLEFTKSLHNMDYDKDMTPHKVSFALGRWKIAHIKSVDYKYAHDAKYYIGSLHWFLLFFLQVFHTHLFLAEQTSIWHSTDFADSIQRYNLICYKIRNKKKKT
jgi:hypothetical protein